MGCCVSRKLSKKEVVDGVEVEVHAKKTSSNAKDAQQPNVTSVSPIHTHTSNQSNTTAIKHTSLEQRNTMTPIWDRETYATSPIPSNTYLNVTFSSNESILSNDPKSRLVCNEESVNENKDHEEYVHVASHQAEIKQVTTTDTSTEGQTDRSPEGFVHVHSDNNLEKLEDRSTDITRPSLPNEPPPPAPTVSVTNVLAKSEPPPIPAFSPPITPSPSITLSQAEALDIKQYVSEKSIEPHEIHSVQDMETHSNPPLSTPTANLQSSHVEDISDDISNASNEGSGSPNMDEYYVVTTADTTAQ